MPEVQKLKLMDFVTLRNIFALVIWFFLFNGHQSDKEWIEQFDYEQMEKINQIVGSHQQDIKYYMDEDVASLSENGKNLFKHLDLAGLDFGPISYFHDRNEYQYILDSWGLSISGGYYAYYYSENEQNYCDVFTLDIRQFEIFLRSFNSYLGPTYICTTLKDNWYLHYHVDD